MTNKYGEAIGVWDLMIGRTKEQGPLQLHPTHKDNRKLLAFLMDEKNKSNQAVILDKIAAFLDELISKEYPPENDNEKEQLTAYINSNLIELMNETLVVFKLAKKEDLEQVKKELLQVEKIEKVSEPSSWQKQ